MLVGEIQIFEIGRIKTKFCRTTIKAEHASRKWVSSFVKEKKFSLDIWTLRSLHLHIRRGKPFFEQSSCCCNSSSGLPNRTNKFSAKKTSWNGWVESLQIERRPESALSYNSYIYKNWSLSLLKNETVDRALCFEKSGPRLLKDHQRNRECRARDRRHVPSKIFTQTAEMALFK